MKKNDENLSRPHAQKNSTYVLLGKKWNQCEILPRRKPKGNPPQLEGGKAKLELAA